MREEDCYRIAVGGMVGQGQGRGEDGFKGGNGRVGSGSGRAGNGSGSGRVGSCG